MRIFIKLSIFTLFFLLGLLIAKNNIISPNQSSLFNGTGKNFNESLDISEIEIVKVQEKKTTPFISGEIYVPKYWKYGENTNSEDYLEGYIPNIRSFKDYWQIHNNLSYGINPFNYRYNIEEVFNQFETNGIFHKTVGIENESTFFQWNQNECKTYYSNRLNSTVFLCNNWVNWTYLDLINKEYALVECTLEKTKGYCIFEDYIKIYYDSRRYGESRCFGENDLYCDFDRYLNIISLN